MNDQGPQDKCVQGRPGARIIGASAPKTTPSTRSNEFQNVRLAKFDVPEAGFLRVSMRAALGSAGWTRYAREDAIFDSISYSNIDNKFECPDDNIVSTWGPAGTFYIFVTDTRHGVTAVEHGKIREIIRSEARPIRIKDWTAWANR